MSEIEFRFNHDAFESLIGSQPLPEAEIGPAIEGTFEVLFDGENPLSFMLVIRPTDKIIVRVPERCSRSEGARLTRLLEEYLGREVLVIHGDIDFLTFREERGRIDE